MTKNPHKIDPESSVRRTHLELHGFAALQLSLHFLHSTEENGDLIKSADKHRQVSFKFLGAPLSKLNRKRYFLQLIIS